MTRRSKTALVALVIALALGATGCTFWAPYTAPVIPPPGFLYSDVRAPLILPTADWGDVDLSEVEVHTSHFQIPYAWLRLINVAWGDAAVQRAIEESGFRRVLWADYRHFTILSVYSTFTVNVYGTR